MGKVGNFRNSIRTCSVLLFAVGLVSAARAQECPPLIKFASVKLETLANSRRVLVPITINNVPKKFLLDTAGMAAYITKESAVGLNLEPMPGMRNQVKIIKTFGLGGRTYEVPNTLANDTTLIAAEYPNDPQALKVIDAVRRQYEHLEHVAGGWANLRPGTVKEDLGSRLIADLATIQGEVQVQRMRHGEALILHLSANRFRVIFAVPMRIPPRLEFVGLPSGTKSVVTDNSTTGFTVEFYSPSAPIEKFGFVADAEL